MGECSDRATFNRGVPQDSAMDPLLFDIFYELLYMKVNWEITIYVDNDHR